MHAEVYMRTHIYPLYIDYTYLLSPRLLAITFCKMFVSLLSFPLDKVASLLGGDRQAKSTSGISLFEGFEQEALLSAGSATRKGCGELRFFRRGSVRAPAGDDEQLGNLREQREARFGGVAVSLRQRPRAS